MSTWTSFPHLKWRAKISPESLVIAAACARPYVQAAVAAGHPVVAADLFCDSDTRSRVARVLQLEHRDGGFDRASVERDLLPALAGADGFVYGSGFEAQPDLIQTVASHCRVYGNDADTLAACKNPAPFFAMLARLGIACPETRPALSGGGEGWLSKRIGGSGGVHIRPAMPPAADFHYFQRRVAGEPCSLLFLADGRKVMPIGYNRLLVAPSNSQPYRYGGAVSRAALPQAVQNSLLLAAQKITAELHLRGLNSLDCMVDGERACVLEINPRLSASFALYDAPQQGAALFEGHLRGCDGDLMQPLPDEPAQAHLIYYALSAMSIASGFAWPAWTADRPAAASRIEVDAPVCTVTAHAETADQALAIAAQRLSRLKQDMDQFMEPSTHAC
ncbi:MAG: ATP-grasp domain-containing protein [Methylobacterium sp.]|nr:ATP-grasp domain-containing protein [Methylobacterium sp.]